MKRSIIIFFGALAIFMAGCTGDVIAPVPESSPEGDRAWVSDLSLPVPIELGICGGTKAVNKIADMDSLVFGMFALNKDADEIDALLYNEVASFICDEDKTSGRFKFGYPGEEGRTKWYPYHSEENYSFYAYYYYALDSCVVYVPENESQSSKLLVNMPVAVPRDILWGKAESGSADGFNAWFIRKSGMIPSFRFGHPAAGLSFSASLTDPMPDKTYLLVEQLKFLDIPVRANLCLMDCDAMSSVEGTLCEVTQRADRLLYRGNSGLMDSGSLQKKIESEVHEFIGDDLFIVPQEEPLKCELLIRQYVYSATSDSYVVYANHILEVVFDPSEINPQLNGHQAGKHYRYNIELGYSQRKPYIKSVGISNASR